MTQFAKSQFAPTATRKAEDGVVSGSAPTPEYGNPTYRLWRVHLSDIEIIGVLVAALLAALAIVSVFARTA